MKQLWEGLFKKNPVLVLALGLVPAVAVTTTAANGLALGIITTVIWLIATVVNHFIRPLVPANARLAVRVVVLTALVAVAYGYLLGQYPGVVASLGIFLPLLVVNDLLLQPEGAGEGLASTLLQRLGQGLGFVLALVVIGVIREFFGFGAIFGKQIMTGSLAPMSLASSVPGGLIIVGLLLALANLVTKQGGELHD